MANGAPPAASSAGSEPRFTAGGPNAEAYGAREGYPVRVVGRLPFFVGLFSHYDQILEGRPVRRAATPSRLARAAAGPALRYEYQGETRTLVRPQPEDPIEETLALWRGVVGDLGG